MFLRKFFLVTALAVGFSGVAIADDDDDGDDDGNGNAFAQCLRTQPVHFDGTIVDAALATPELSTLVFAVQAAGLVDALNGEGPLTVFAPTDDAFAAIPDEILNAIIADVDLLTAVLTYHVIDGAGRRMDPRRASFRARERNTLQGQSVFFNYSAGGPQINQSTADCTAVRTTNGVVWLIDSVLLPQF